LVLQASFVINKNLNSINLLENFLDERNYEYQSYNDIIEIYDNESEVLIIEFKEIKILMYHQNKKHEYSTIDNKIFKKIDNILN